MGNSIDLGTDTIGTPLYTPSAGPATRGAHTLRQQLEILRSADLNLKRTITGDHTPQSVLHPPLESPMSDMSPGLIQRVIDRLRAISADPVPQSHLPVSEQVDPKTGRRIPVSTMNEVDRMAAGLPPIQR